MTWAFGFASENVSTDFVDGLVSLSANNEQVTRILIAQSNPRGKADAKRYVKSFEPLAQAKIGRY